MCVCVCVCVCVREVPYGSCMCICKEVEGGGGYNIRGVVLLVSGA